MSVLGTMSVTLLKDNDRAGLKAGDVVDAECWLGLDAYQPCAEVKVPSKDSGHLMETVGLGRMDYSKAWRFTDDAVQADFDHFLKS